MKNNELSPQNSSELNKGLTTRNLRDKALAGLEDCLNATVTIMGKNGQLHTSPDFKTIIVAVQTALAYTDGKPIERREVITKHMTTLEELKSKAKSSPELRKAIAELLDEKNVAQVVAKPA